LGATFTFASGSSGAPTSLTFSPNGKMLVVISPTELAWLNTQTEHGSGVLHAWEDEKRHSLSSPVLNSHYSPDGKTLACRDVAGRILLFRNNSRLSGTLRAPGNNSPLAFSADSLWLANANNDGQVRFGR
jgi:WD40 repeat protein